MVDEKGYCCQVIESNRIVIERELNKPLPMIKKKIMEILKNLLNAEFVKIHLNRWCQLKVHDHITGKYTWSVHQDCNLNLTIASL